MLRCIVPNNRIMSVVTEAGFNPRVWFQSAERPDCAIEAFYNGGVMPAVGVGHITTKTANESISLHEDAKRDLHVISIPHGRSHGATPTHIRQHTTTD